MEQISDEETGEQNQVRTDYAELLKAAQQGPDDQLEQNPEAELSPESAANYAGNWMNLQQSRMKTADFRTKFARLNVIGATDSVPQNSAWPQKPHMTPHEVSARVDKLPQTIQEVYASVDYGPANVHDSVPTALGRSYPGQPGIVFSDAEDERGPLSNRGKDIIAAHEASHSVVQVPAAAYEVVTSGFDWEAQRHFVDSSTEPISRPNYLRKPEELLARMSQLKNYFGMKADEPFTSEHLDYAKAHYIEDTQLDNRMTEFFAIVTDKSKDRFIKNMNSLPI